MGDAQKERVMRLSTSSDLKGDPMEGEGKRERERERMPTDHLPI